MTEENQPHRPPPTAPIPEGSAPPAPPATEGTGLAGSPTPPDRSTSPARSVAEPAPARPEPASPAPGFDERGRVRATKVSGVWVGLIGTALFLILLVIFVAQNSRRVSLHFFGWHGQFSLALTILISAVIGVLLVAIPGTVRIIQLRRALRRNGPRP